MRQIWFTSDTHFGHKNIIKYSNRPFESVEEMDEAMIKNWNDRVRPNDEIYHLGDFAFHRAEQIKNILGRLNGKIFFIRGNHDEAFDKERNLQGRFASVQDYKEIKIDGQKIVLCHFPLLTWNKAHRGAWHLHGHCHGSLNHLNVGTTRIDIGVDNFNYTPVSFDEIKSKLKDVQYTPVDHHDSNQR
jgi:calcineurin-like phosphoesterase family protein